MQHGVCRPDEVNVYLGAGMRFIPAESGPDVNAPELHPQNCKKMENALANFIGRCYTIFMAVSFLYCRPDGLRFVLNRVKSQMNKGTLKIED